MDYALVTALLQESGSVQDLLERASAHFPGGVDLERNENRPTVEELTGLVAVPMTSDGVALWMPMEGAGSDAKLEDDEETTLAKIQELDKNCKATGIPRSSPMEHLCKVSDVLQVIPVKDGRGAAFFPRDSLDEPLYLATPCHDTFRVTFWRISDDLKSAEFSGFIKPGFDCMQGVALARGVDAEPHVLIVADGAHCRVRNFALRIDSQTGNVDATELEDVALTTGWPWGVAASLKGDVFAVNSDTAIALYHCKDIRAGTPPEFLRSLHGKGGHSLGLCFDGADNVVYQSTSSNVEVESVSGDRIATLSFPEELKGLCIDSQRQRFFVAVSRQGVLMFSIGGSVTVKSARKR